MLIKQKQKKKNEPKKDPSLLEDLKKLRKLELEADQQQDGFYFDFPDKLKSFFNSEKKIPQKEPESEQERSRSSHQSSASSDKRPILKPASQRQSRESGSSGNLNLAVYRPIDRHVRFIEEDKSFDQNVYENKVQDLSTNKESESLK